MQNRLNRRRTNETDEMLGPSQIAWVAEETNGGHNKPRKKEPSSTLHCFFGLTGPLIYKTLLTGNLLCAASAAAGTVWQLYATGLVMQDWFSPVSPTRTHVLSSQPLIWLGSV